MVLSGAVVTSLLCMPIYSELYFPEDDHAMTDGV